MKSIIAIQISTIFFLGMILLSVIKTQDDVKELSQVVSEERLSYCDTILYFDTIKAPVEEVYIINTTLTKYNAVPGQTDDTPFNTGDGSFIDTTLLRSGELRWIALSQDLLWFNNGPFHYGDSVYIHSEQEYIKGWWELHDAMNPRYTNRVDILQPLGNNTISGQNPNILISNKKI